MDFGLRGKTVLVLAGGGGLGRAIAKSLASARSPHYWSVIRVDGGMIASI
jgi:NAD(P)-dependent dehydrogenase (short-subunit alcohol dehydrogenase family)